MTFIERKFNIPTLVDISERTISEHLKLYSGYVKHANLIEEKIKELSSNLDANSYIIGELRRRFGFEFDGIRNHEYYFEQFEGGFNQLSETSELSKKISETFGGYEVWLTQFKQTAMTRGIGWAIVYFDTETGKLMNTWVDEQHLGHLTSVKVILALDMWEHSYMLDVAPSEKKTYIEAFFKNLNWTVVSERFNASVSQKSM